MALEEDDQHQQQPKTIETSHSLGNTEDPQSTPTLPLPVVIISNILTRLPVESLLRFRSVCNLWRCIISDTHFIKSHLTFSTTNINNNRYPNHRLIFRTKTTSSINNCPLYDLLYDGSINALELDYSLTDNNFSIVDSINGLLLIANKVKYMDDVLFIWNPITRKSIRLPNCGLQRGPRAHSWYEFGYDESADDYKVVAISYVSWDQGRCDMIVKIYSLNTGNWKKVDDIPLNYSVKYLNGALYWMTVENSLKIIYRDLAKGTDGEIVQPVYDEGYADLTLGVLGGWLCVVCDYSEICADVWVMKVKDSWTKLVSFPYHLTDDFRWCQFSVPLCISNDGKVLLQVGSKLVVYDSKICSFSVIQNFNECLEACIFVESLVSPEGRLQR